MAGDVQPTWEISSQEEGFGTNGAGQYVPGVTVRFRTDAGTVGSVFVPHSDYTVANVKALVSEKAAAMRAVAALTG